MPGIAKVPCSGTCPPRWKEVRASMYRYLSTKEQLSTLDIGFVDKIARHLFTEELRMPFIGVALLMGAIARLIFRK